MRIDCLSEVGAHQLGPQLQPVLILLADNQPLHMPVTVLAVASLNEVPQLFQRKMPLAYAPDRRQTKPVQQQIPSSR